MNNVDQIGTKFIGRRKVFAHTYTHTDLNIFHKQTDSMKNIDSHFNGKDKFQSNFDLTSGTHKQMPHQQRGRSCAFKIKKAFSVFSKPLSVVNELSVRKIVKIDDDRDV